MFARLAGVLVGVVAAVGYVGVGDTPSDASRIVDELRRRRFRDPVAVDALVRDLLAIEMRPVPESVDQAVDVVGACRRVVDELERRGPVICPDDPLLVAELRAYVTNVIHNAVIPYC